MIDIVPEISEFVGQFGDYSFLDYSNEDQKRRIEKRLHYSTIRDTDEKFRVWIENSQNSNF